MRRRDFFQYLNCSARPIMARQAGQVKKATLNGDGGLFPLRRMRRHMVGPGASPSASKRRRDVLTRADELYSISAAVLGGGGAFAPCCGLLPHHLDDDLTLSTAGVALEQHDLLPGSEHEPAVLKRNSDRRTEKSRSNVAGAVVVVPTQMMLIIGVARCQMFEQPVEVGDRARFKFDGRNRRCRTHDECRRYAVATGRFAHGARNDVGDVVRVTLILCAHTCSVSKDHDSD